MVDDEPRASTTEVRSPVKHARLADLPLDPRTVVSAPSRRSHGSPTVLGRPGCPEERTVKPSRTAIRFDPLLPFETWKAIGPRIATYSTASAWWLGDWLAFGRMKYGRRYKEAIAATGLDYQTLRNYAVVARRFAPSRRRDNLSFQHHAEVCALSDDDQELWLDLAAMRGWSKRELRRRIRAAGDAAHAPASSSVLRLTVDADRDHLWRRAAERCDASLQAWIERTLDAAAGATLDVRAGREPVQP
jgi:hypothetical protein